MSTCTISKIARSFGLSRSTLLYYDRIGLLTPSGRTESGYRTYTVADRKRLESICQFRQAGLALEDIRRILASEDKPPVRILERRLYELTAEILELKAKQSFLVTMLKGMASDCYPSRVDKVLWIDMLRAAGMDEEAMECWHTEFERRAPEAHHEFLLSLGISEEEALQIRDHSSRGKGGDKDPDR